jgi:hypothetical protein
VIKIPPKTVESQSRHPNMNPEILSELRETKQTQTQFQEVQKKLSTLNSIKNQNSEISQISEKLQNQQSDDQVIDMDEIQEMISGSGLDFGKKVKSDFIHSHISDIKESQGDYRSNKDKVFQTINAESGVYTNNQSQSKNCNF